MRPISRPIEGQPEYEVGDTIPIVANSFQQDPSPPIVKIEARHIGSPTLWHWVYSF